MSKRVKKEIREWGIFVSIIAILYFTGLHTEVAAFAQRMVLTTGIMTPNTELDEDFAGKLDYNFKIRSVDGKVTQMSEFKDKVIFINLWATWCAPCRAEMPSIQSLYDKMKDNENIVFVMLSMDSNDAKVKKFMDKKSDYSFPIYLPASDVPMDLRSPSIPTTYVIGKNGEIVSKKVGMAKYDSKSFQNFLIKQVNK